MTIMENIFVMEFFLSMEYKIEDVNNHLFKWLIANALTAMVVAKWFETSDNKHTYRVDVIEIFVFIPYFLSCRHCDPVEKRK